ncbi:MAG: hypothetical protein KF761_13950 [Salinibacterium sp.]|nr:hypothetical protein [Salinibacterium sp.]
MADIDINSLNRVFDDMHSHMSRIQGDIEEVHNNVGVIARDLSTTTTELRELRQEFQEFVTTAQRVANVQRSETKLGNLKGDLEREFGHYSIVRRSSIGTLQAFDVGNVSDKTVQQISEELMIQTPRYWLAPALVGLAAWSRDDKSLSDKSVDAAFSRDKAKTSLFFALVLRRQGRLDAATRWLRHYFASLDPRNLSREFGVVLESVAGNAFGPAGQELVIDKLVEWTDLLREDETIVEEQVANWRTEIAVQRGVVNGGLFPRMAAFSPTWDRVKDGLEHASALENVRVKYQAVFDSTPSLKSSLEDQMDDILETLVTEYDGEELPLRREIVFHEAVLEHDGDMARARESADFTVEALEEGMDAASLVTQAALHPDLMGIGVATQKLSIGAGKQDFELATGRYTQEYRAAWPSSVDIVLDSAHSNYATALGFGTWRSNSSTPEAVAEKALSAEWDRVITGFIEANRFKLTAIIVPALITVGVSLLFALGGVLWFFIGLVLAGGISTLLVLRRKRKADAAVAEAQRNRDAAFAVSRDIYRELTAEWVDARILYSEQDGTEADVLRLIEAWPAINLGKTVVAE